MKTDEIALTASAIFAAFMLASVALGLISATVKETGVVIEWRGHSVYVVQFPN